MGDFTLFLMIGLIVAAATLALLPYPKGRDDEPDDGASPPPPPRRRL